MAGVIMRDIFIVNEVNPDGKNFEKVSRIFAKSQTMDMELILDINSSIYALDVKDEFHCMLTISLYEDGRPKSTSYDAKEKLGDLADEYDYIMLGRVYHFEDSSEMNGRETSSAYLSFGGLLMKIRGYTDFFSHMSSDMELYILIKKIKSNPELHKNLKFI